jgi:hypothetical protein
MKGIVIIVSSRNRPAGVPEDVHWACPLVHRMSSAATELSTWVHCLRERPVDRPATAGRALGRRGNVPGRARRPCAGRFPADARSPGPRRDFPMIPACRGVLGTEAVDVPRNGQQAVRQVPEPAAIPPRQLMRTLIRVPLKGGMPWRR